MYGDIPVHHVPDYRLGIHRAVLPAWDYTRIGLVVYGVQTQNAAARGDGSAEGRAKSAEVVVLKE